MPPHSTRISRVRRYQAPRPPAPACHIAACLAVAEAERASAAELVTAIVLAYEINCRLIDALDITTRGWDVPVFSLPAVALAAGKLMKLPVDKLTQAGSAASHAAGGREHANKQRK
jgi:2-methylcitrate dehydratase